MVSPVTNCSPIMRIAMSTPRRTSGSPPRADDAPQRARQARFAVRGHQLAGDQQPPGRGVDEQRRALPEVRLPVAAGDLVANQRVARGRVRNPQQRFGQAHQRHAFLRAERELLEQPLDQAGSTAIAAALAHAARDPQRQCLCRLGLRRVEPCPLEQRGQQCRLGQPGGGGDGGTQRRRRCGGGQVNRAAGHRSQAGSGRRRRRGGACRAR